MTPAEYSPFATFLENYPLRKISKGEIIIFQGEEPRSSYVVKSGVVKVYNLSVNGDEKPVGFETSQGVFPAPWTFRKAPSALYYYEAFTDTELYIVPRDEYVAFLKSNQEALVSTLEQYVSNELGSTMRLNALQHSRASDKLIYTLHYLAISHGKPTTKPNVIEITLDLTHQDFANFTGLTRETTATELNKLKTRKVISYGKRVPYTLDLTQLNAMMNDQYLADMQLTL
ncbi:MAG: Crp/Fnr family transcriptional regulator [Candidatus Saccharimonadales bacterium]